MVSAVSEGRRGKRPLPCEEEDGRRTLRKRSKVTGVCVSSQKSATMTRETMLSKLGRKTQSIPQNVL